MTAIVGPSGAGKTSLLYVLSGLDRPDSGRVTIGGTDVYALNETSRLIRGHIGFVFQQYNLVPYLTVEENVMLPLSLAHRKADYVQVTQLLSRFGLRQRAKTTVSALSGGEQQRVALCRALLMRPAVVFADEPTGALDTANSELVLQVLRELADAGSSVVMVTHDTDAAALADHVIFLRDGQVTHIAGRLTAEQDSDGIRRTFVPAGSPPLVAPARSVGPMMVNAQHLSNPSNRADRSSAWRIRSSGRRLIVARYVLRVFRDNVTGWVYHDSGGRGGDHAGGHMHEPIRVDLVSVVHIGRAAGWS